MIKKPYILDIFYDLYINIKLFYILKKAIELKIFDILSEPKTFDEILIKINLDKNILEYILKILLELKLIEKIRGKYKNTLVSDLYLRENSEFSIIPYLEDEYFNDIENWKDFKEKRLNFTKVIHKMANECKVWELPRIMEYIRLRFKNEIKNAKKLLDLAGGHGLYAIYFSKLNKNLKCYVFDLPEVIEETRKYIEKYKAKNIELIKGNFWKDSIGENYDIIFSSYHPGGKNPEIIRKVYDALNIGGLFINKQFFWDGEEDLEFYVNNIDWLMRKSDILRKSPIRFTFEGDLSFNDYLDYLENLGFEILDIVDLKEFLELKCYRGSKMIISKKVE
ncbi:conserved hypothetical protein [Methanocaldococcus infernus ME]|uniref:Methyltransferase type 12 n=1 Tax=Methanocaldococcus infernus (strain DSM 11812 / JCM 15783 / ME) TaxID=573063 RepID=D5VU22_METIM|nr:methyltransferase [Methanocaldococcus infernus]ADG14075.1 conserved hypothetical protein [Methanocaldococcus infernus ME]